MAELIIYRGNQDISVTPVNDICYVYRIGSGYVKGGKFIEINDISRLNTLAEEIRDDYSSWIFSRNQQFLDANLKLKDISLFFLTDLSCKRSDLFDVYDSICNLLFIRERLSDVSLSKIRLIGVDRGFVQAIQSIFSCTEVIALHLSKPQTNQRRRIVADFLYLGRFLVAVVSNKLSRVPIFPRINTLKKCLFSIYPQMFSIDGRETKYGSFVKQSDQFVVSILTDGMHQKVSALSYAKHSREAERAGLLLVDRFLRITDVVLGLYWMARTNWFYFQQINTSYVFKNIEISGLLQPLLLYSLSHIIRLCALMGAWRRFFATTNIREFVYYPHEYPFGRMISYILNAVQPRTVRTGFQMGMSSLRRTEQFLAVGEPSQQNPFLEHAPIPDRILAEDKMAQSIYIQSGYKSVEIMEKIYRYEYLESVVPEKRDSWVLIAPGLHDGEFMLGSLRNHILRNPQKNFILKPHPRGDNGYVRAYEEISNLEVSALSVYEIFRTVSEVFVTYSTVGIEAELLEIPVTVISIPGKITTSPLLDRVDSTITDLRI